MPAGADPGGDPGFGIVGRNTTAVVDEAIDDASGVVERGLSARNAITARPATPIQIQRLSNELRGGVDLDCRERGLLIDVLPRHYRNPFGWRRTVPALPVSSCGEGKVR